MQPVLCCCAAASSSPSVTNSLGGNVVCTQIFNIHKEVSEWSFLKQEKRKNSWSFKDIWNTRLEAPSRVPLPSVLLFDFIAIVCFHFAANFSIIPSVLYFLPKRSSSVTNPRRRNTQKYSIDYKLYLVEHELINKWLKKLVFYYHQEDIQTDL